MKLPDVLSNPWVGFIGTVIGIISLVVSIYLYLVSIKEPDLTYMINPVRTTVLRSGLAADLRVLHSDKEITGNVTAVQVAIWNNGREPITQDTILRPIVIRTRPAVPILEATIRKKNRDEVNFAIETSASQNGEVGVSWRILERSDGASVQLLYAGPAESEIVLDGAIVGQTNISTGHPPLAPSNEVVSVFLSIIRQPFFIIIVLIATIAPPATMLLLRKRLKRFFTAEAKAGQSPDLAVLQRIGLFAVITLSLQLVLIPVMVFYMRYKFPTPPIGF